MKQMLKMIYCLKNILLDKKWANLCSLIGHHIVKMMRLPVRIHADLSCDGDVLAGPQSF